MDWGGFEEQGDMKGLAGFGGLQGVVVAADDGGDGEHAVVGEAGDLGFEVAGDHVAEFAEGVADDVGVFGGFVASHFGGEADGDVGGGEWSILPDVRGVCLGGWRGRVCRPPARGTGGSPGDLGVP
jgi:hypothetical protein